MLTSYLRTQRFQRCKAPTGPSRSPLHSHLKSARPRPTTAHPDQHTSEPAHLNPTHEQFGGIHLEHESSDERGQLPVCTRPSLHDSRRLDRSEIDANDLDPGGGGARGVISAFRDGEG